MRRMTPTKSTSPAKRGRPANTSSKSGQVRELLKTGMAAADIAKKVGCTTGLVYNIKSTSGKSAKRGPGRPKNTASAGLDSIAGIVAAVQSSDRDRARLRGALERIQTVLADVLR